MRWNTLDYHGGWIRPGSFSTHRKSAAHLHSLEVEAAATEKEQAENPQIPSPPHIAATLNTPVTIVAGVEQQDEISQEQSTSQAEQDFWGALDPSSAVFEMDDGPEIALQQKRQKFECKLDEYGVWEDEENILDHDVVGALEQAWDESEQDEVLSDILRGLGKRFVSFATANPSDLFLT